MKRKPSQSYPIVLVSVLLIAAVLFSACTQTSNPGLPNTAGGSAQVAEDDMMDNEAMDDDMAEDDMMDNEATDADLAEDDMMDNEAMDDDMAEDDMMDNEAMDDDMAEDDMMDNEAMDDDMAEDDMMDNEAMDDDMAEDDMMGVPAWFDVTLTDVTSGQSFTINDLHGQVVLVETMAIWCSNCLRQQRQVLELHELLGERDDFVSLGLDIDPNEDALALEAFTASNGFTWRYAVAPVEVSRQLSELYGAQFLNPPSTPMLIIDRDGQVHTLPFGIKDAQTLYEALQPFLAEGM